MLGNDSISFDNGDRRVVDGNSSLAVVLIVKDGKFVNIDNVNTK